MQFDVVKTLKLDFLGGDWKECSMEFRAVSVKQARKLSAKDKDDLLEEGMSLLKENFVKGDGVSKGKKVTITKEDLENLPIDVINRAIELLAADVGSEEAQKKN